MVWPPVTDSRHRAGRLRLRLPDGGVAAKRGRVAGRDDRRPATIAQHCDGVRCDMAMLGLNDVFAQTWQRRVDLLWDAPTSEFWPGATRHVPMT